MKIRASLGETLCFQEGYPKDSELFVLTLVTSTFSFFFERAARKDCFSFGGEKIAFMARPTTITSFVDTKRVGKADGTVAEIALPTCRIYVEYFTVWLECIGQG